MIRRARKGDYKDIIRLYGEWLNDAKRFSGFDSDSFLKVLKDKNSFIDVAVERKVIGFITYSIRRIVRYPRPILEVEDLYVIPARRRKGIGRRLVENAVGCARNNNCQHVFIASGKKWKDAHKFYSALGFDQYAYHYRRKP